jgi:uncharacterized membrane protein
LGNHVHYFDKEIKMSKKKDSSNVFNVLAFNFAGKDTAKETLKDIKVSEALGGEYIVAQIIVEQDEKGKVHVHETGRGGAGAAIGGVAGGILSLFGGPVGFLTWVVGGAVLGGVAGKYLGRPFKKGDLKEVGEAMVPDSSAFLLLVEDIYAEAVAESLSGVSANSVTLTVGDELSGELAQFAAGAVSVDAGDDTDSDSKDDN